MGQKLNYQEIKSLIKNKSFKEVESGELKNPNILKEKPNLKLMSNHFKEVQHVTYVKKGKYNGNNN